MSVQNMVLVRAAVGFRIKQRAWTTGVNTTDKDRREKNQRPMPQGILQAISAAG
ncbi:MAG: hypothetical protein KBI10_03735 [Syntrophorhabdales bacterium]|nr:hypothetical protein [Syntrophorhabdales bacterium]